MLSQILIRHIVRWIAMLALLAAVLTSAVFGWSSAVGVLVGAALIGVSCIGLVLIVGRLLDPTRSTVQKATVAILLVAKMTVIGGVLYLCLVRWGVSPLGLVLGIGTGLVAIQTGLVRGSASDEGKRAIEETEARIREELGDSNDESS